MGYKYVYNPYYGSNVSCPRCNGTGIEPKKWDGSFIGNEIGRCMDCNSCPVFVGTASDTKCKREGCGHSRSRHHYENPD